MMRWILGSSLKFRRLVIALSVGLLVYGVLQLDDARTDILPEFQRPTVEVQTEALGLSAEEVEELITVPLEQDLLVGIAFLDEIESVSLPGLSSVVMTFEPGTEVLDARQVVAERLTQAVGGRGSAPGGPTAADDPARVVDQPRRDGENDIGPADPDRDVHPVQVGHQPTAARGGGGSQRLHVGVP